MGDARVPTHVRDCELSSSWTAVPGEISHAAEVSDDTSEDQSLARSARAPRDRGRCPRSAASRWPARRARARVASRAPRSVALVKAHEYTARPRPKHDATGERGLPGERGPRGDAGPAGSSGPAGPAGLQGVPGRAGLPGPIGPKGDDGSDGVDGVDGDPGARGSVGETGQAGAAGAEGPTGPRGLTGLQGAAGSQGPQGAAGAQGAAWVPSVRRVSWACRASSGCRARRD